MASFLKNLIKEFEEDNKYIQYLKKEGGYHFFPENFFTLKTEQERLEAWENIEVKLKEIKDFNKVANPYYIGFGNPEADLLIVGQEKAFNAFNNPELMLYESINNTFQWSKLAQNPDTDEILFDPRNPRKYHDKKLKGNHTWSKYSILADAFYGINSCHENIKKDWDKNLGETLFDKAFITELNVTPAANNSGIYLTDERKKLLQNPFFKKFKAVVFAIGNPDDGEKAQRIVSEIFEGTIFELDTIGKYGKDKERRIAFSSKENQVYAICNQLSGSSGWKNDHIVALGERLRELID
ncbi:hypothetical protein [Marivirga sp.]|uniref:hypothetical protein n=1 Tax=Marivirga sp. TaxID=2018662 RepID=UPI0025F0E750|nr:hypothetical protein [Marivirga sp.]